MNGDRYKPILESAKKEQSAKGQCRWIIAVLEILALNHLPHLEKYMKDIRKENRRGTNRIMAFLFVVLLVVLATNPQVGDVVSKLFAFVF